MTTERCACGEPLHYVDVVAQQQVTALVAKLGPTIPVNVAGSHRGFRVPRHYIALHGLTPAELPELAARYGWEPT